MMLCNMVGWENIQGIQQPVGSLNSPTKLVVWSFGVQSTVPSLLHMAYGKTVHTEVLGKTMQYA